MNARYIRVWLGRRLLSRRVAELGRDAYIDRPEMLGGPEGLYLGDEVLIRPHARIECIRSGAYRGKIVIGARTSAQLYFHCAAAQLVTIGTDVLIAGRVYITDHDHAWPEGGEKLVVAPVTIGDRCWIGEGAAILKGVELGAGCVVGANAVVARSAPAGSMLVGAPARPVKRFDPQSGQWRRVQG
jgi:acetyltransferase-like isoleucine patch superfamily enzyme